MDINVELLQWSKKELAEELHKKLIIRKFFKKESTLTFCRQYLGC